MPLVVRGKTNLLYILIVIIIAVIASGGILVYQLWWTSVEQNELPKLEKIEPFFETSNEFLEVISLIPNQEIKSPIQVVGKSNFFEANTRIRIKDNNGKILVDTFTTAEGWMGELHPFSKDVSYEKPSSKKGTVEVFEESAKDGREIHKISIPVIFEDFSDETADLEAYRDEEFCGSSTNKSCISDSGCVTGGCSGQVCQSKSEESVITTCEWRDCYDETRFGLECKCVDSKCQWTE